MVRVNKENRIVSRLTAGLILLLTVTSLLLSANPGSAAVSNPGAWTSVNDTNPNIASVNVTSATQYTAQGTHGDKRVVAIAVVAGSAAANTVTNGTVVVKMGNITATKITGNEGTAGRVTTWVGYIREDKIPNGAQNITVAYTGSSATTSLKIYCATFSGIDQANPIAASSQIAATAAAASPSSRSMTFGADELSFIVTGNSVASTISSYTPATYTQAVTTSGNSMPGYVANRAVGTAAAAEGTTVTYSVATGYPAISVVALNTDASNTVCSSCHGYPPVDNSTRNASTGQFPGTHNTHAGPISTVGQYGYSCSTCHRDQVSSSHSRGTITMANPINGNTGAKYGNYTSYAVSNGALAGKQCTNTYCHSNATSVSTGTIPANSSPAWGGAVGSLSCTGCHGSGADGRPSYSSGSPKANTHGNSAAGYGITHLNTPCTRCHNSVTGSAGAYAVDPLLHANGTYTVAAANVGYTYAVDGGTCSATGTGCHGTATVKWGGTLGCVDCHSGAIGSPVASSINSTVTQRRDIVTEFKQVWSHKRSTSGGVPANTVVTNEDCVVCHMEGNFSTKKKDAAYHGNGYIDLRDPDTGSPIQGVTWSGTGAGSYTSTGTPSNAVRFSRNLSSNSLEPFVTAMMVNQCLKCHDSVGATAAYVTGGSAQKPFNTTIAGAAYTGSGVTAGGAAGAVTDIAASFQTTNSSYHPVLGKQNNSYTQGTRMAAPWNMTKTTGNTTSWGYLISCWDCHAPDGTASTVTLTSTVTAHGGATTLRGRPTATGSPVATTNESTLCKLCHVGYNRAGSHNTGSAFTSSVDSGMNNYLNYACNACHSSSYGTIAVRPVRGIDVHGSNVVPTGTTTKRGRWASATNNGPIAFIRNSNFFPNHQPKQIGSVTYTPQCMGGSTSPCSQGTQSYSAGGTY